MTETAIPATWQPMSQWPRHWPEADGPSDRILTTDTGFITLAQDPEPDDETRATLAYIWWERDGSGHYAILWRPFTAPALPSDDLIRAEMDQIRKAAT